MTDTTHMTKAELAEELARRDAEICRLNEYFDRLDTAIRRYGWTWEQAQARHPFRQASDVLVGA